MHGIQDFWEYVSSAKFVDKGVGISCDIVDKRIVVTMVVQFVFRATKVDALS